MKIALIIDAMSVDYYVTTDHFTNILKSEGTLKLKTVRHFFIIFFK